MYTCATMKKNFEAWFPLKKYIHNERSIENIYFREGEVWWCNFGVNVGSEQDGKGPDSHRPVLIIKKFNKFGFVGLPLTTQQKEGEYFVKCDLAEDNIERFVTLSQIRTLDSKRLIDKIGIATEKSFLNIKTATRNMF